MIAALGSGIVGNRLIVVLGAVVLLRFYYVLLLRLG
jgi:hypothetical protein